MSFWCSWDMTVPMMIPIFSMMGVYRVLVVDKNRGVDRPSVGVVSLW